MKFSRVLAFVLIGTPALLNTVDTAYADGIDLEALGATVEPDQGSMGGFVFGPDRELRLASCIADFGPFMVAIILEEVDGVLIFGESREELSVMTLTDEEVVLAGGETVFRLNGNSFTATHIDDGTLRADCYDPSSFFELVDAELSN